MKPTFFEDETNIIQYGELLKAMYTEENDSAKKDALHFAMDTIGVMEIKEYKEMIRRHEYVNKRFDDRLAILEIKCVDMKEKISAMQKKIKALLDGYLKAKRDELPEPMQRFIYIGIREIIKNISPGFKKQKEEELKVIISTESDWIRFQSVQEEELVK